MLKPSPEGACLLCGAIMPVKQLKHPYLHKQHCQIFGMKRKEIEEKQPQERDEGAVSRPSR
jgi:hypothetical protein